MYTLERIKEVADRHELNYEGLLLAINDILSDKDKTEYIVKNQFFEDADDAAKCINKYNLQVISICKGYRNGVFVFYEHHSVLHRNLQTKF